MKANIFWDMKLYRLVEVYRRFGGTYHLNHQQQGKSNAVLVA
jgi:hypothetical protein